MYNGWKNRATWNIALWLSNDEGLYNAMKSFALGTAKREGIAKVTYRRFINWAGLVGTRTPDGFKFDGKRLDYRALTEVVRENLPAAAEEE